MEEPALHGLGIKDLKVCTDGVQLTDRCTLAGVASVSLEASKKTAKIQLDDPGTGTSAMIVAGLDYPLHNVVGADSVLQHIDHAGTRLEISSGNTPRMLKKTRRTSLIRLEKL